AIEVVCRGQARARQAGSVGVGSDCGPACVAGRAGLGCRSGLRPQLTERALASSHTPRASDQRTSRPRAAKSVFLFRFAIKIAASGNASRSRSATAATPHSRQAIQAPDERRSTPPLL